MTQEYFCNRQFTEEQREADQVHGIFQSETRTFILNTTDHKFQFTYHYYYEYENSGYEMVKQIRNDTKLGGTYQQEGGKYVGLITEGSQQAQEQVANNQLFHGNNLTGQVEFVLDDGILKVLSIELNPQNLNRKGQIICQNQVYKAK